MDFSNAGAMKSPFSPRVRQSIAGRRPIGLSSAKKNQNKFMQTATEPSGDIVYKTPLLTVETYGAPLPVLVTEALTFASGDVSVRLSPCGWCWVVSGRRVLAWERTTDTAGASSTTMSSTYAAKELTLPQTDLAHKADLVVLFYEDGAQMPSCIGVSPEGIVRYWPSVGQEGACVDVSCELAGQECERLGECTRDGLLLATTTCTLVLLNPTVIDGRATVTCKTLRPPSGWLGGIGRRVSLLFFGSMPVHADTKLVGVVTLETETEAEGGEAAESCVALVCGGPALQLWRGAELYEHSLRRPLADALARPHAPHAPHAEPSGLEVMALDVRAGGPNALLLLVAGVNVARSPEIRYAIAHISVAEPGSPRVLSVSALRGWPGATDEAPRFLPLPRAALLYTSKHIALLSMSSDAAEYIDVSADGDRLLGAELCGGVPLLFTGKHGVLALALHHTHDTHDTRDTRDTAPSLCESPMGSPCPSDMYDGNLSLYEIDPYEVSMVTTDACGKLKTAFLFHLRRDVASCRRLVDELFPPPPPSSSSPGSPSSPSRRSLAQHDESPEERDVDSVLDRTVLKIATEMLDDIPAGDPRWKQRGGGPATNISLGSSAALQIAAQLRDKQRAFSLFVDFLRAAGLWRRLGLVSAECGGGSSRTQAALAALAQRLAAARALRRLQQAAHAQLLDAAIYQVVCGEQAEREPEVEAALCSGALAPADVFYRRVSRVLRVLPVLADAPPHASHADARSAATHVTATILVITSVLSEMQACRAQWAARASGACVPRALLPALLHLHRRAITECARGCADAGARAQLLEAAAALADMLLADAQHAQHAPHDPHAPHAQLTYQRVRREVIQPYIEEGQTERAAALAEKFKDFELLIEMCVKNNEMDRLYSYIDKYSNEGMAELAFSSLAERGGRWAGALLRAAGARWAARLRGWLAAAPAAPARTHLLALHLLAAADCPRAAAALLQLAAAETRSRARMTTMASLAKLCLVASDEPDIRPPDMWQKIESHLSLSELQSALPRDIKIHNGLDTEDTRVFTPEELVQMYVDSESKALTEYDYKKALDLTDYIQDMERRDDMRLRVWCACIVHDDWSSCRVDAPATELHDRKFFRLIELVHIMGGDIELLLPPLDDILTAPELVELVSDPRFHFIIKYGYECVDTSRNEDNMVEG